MECEELLKALRRQEVMDNLRCLGCGHEHRCSTKGCAINRAAAELIEQLAAENEALRHPPNPPLTLEELREMDGEPVWCVNGLGTQRWCLVNCDDEILCCYDSETGLWDGCFYEMTGDGEQGLHPMGWLAYRRKPEENKR